MEKEALDFVYTLQKLYLEQCDVEKILSAIDENTSWIGTGEHEICRCFSDAVRALLGEKEEYEGGFNITDSWYEAVPLQEDSCIVYGEFWADPKDPSAGLVALHYRVSAVCIKTVQGIKLLHLHMSRPDSRQEQGKYFVKNRTKLNNKSLHYRYKQASHGLQEHSTELEILTQDIPGGVHHCRNDVELTLLSMSDEFLEMFGYSRKEIRDIFQDSFIYMIFEDDRSAFVKAAREQQALGTTMEFEYRVRCKNNTLMWVLARYRLVIGEDGMQTFFCILMDITKHKKEQEKLRLMLERHQVILDQTTDILFEWDISSDTIDFSSNWEKKFGYWPISRDISRQIPLSPNIHPDDMFAFLKLMRDTVAGVPYSETEFRIRKYSAEYTWCRIRATTQFDNSNHPIKAIGIIVDIAEEKSRRKALLDAAQHDPLTRLYNKAVTQAKINSILLESDSNTMHTLLLIDIDNFKTINDRFGHQCGDAVLSNMAQMLRSLFRVTDVLGRIGGDEFLVLMANVSNRELVATKAREIVNIFHDFPVEIASELSCSVGIAFYTTDASDYAGLSHCADRALYSIKNSGKANFAFYEDVLCTSAPYSFMRTPTINESSFPSPLNEDLVQYTFQILYNATDTQSAVNRLLETVGRSYDVSRVYVFETSENGRFCSNTFEWCNEGITPEKDHLQHLSFETDLPGFFDLYDENGVFYCQDVQTLSHLALHSILTTQGIVSVLQCYILDAGSFRGYIGFDECRKNHYWAKEQVHTLTIIANLLSTFLVKQRFKEQITILKKQQEHPPFIPGFSKI